MKQSTINKYSEIKQKAKDLGISLREYCKQNNISYNTVTKALSRINENKAEVEYIRDNDGIIQSYKIKVYKRDKLPFETTLTRDEVETIFGLYTYYGGNITARNVANEFPKFTLGDIKNIIRAFGLTKDSNWAAPHLIEELTVEQLAQYRMNLKEKAAFKYADATQERDFKNLLNKMASKINRLEDQVEVAKSLLGPVDYKAYTVKKEPSNEITGIVCLSDLHVGAFNQPEGYLELPEYNENEINRRLDRIIESIKFKSWESIIILNLGDNIDSYQKLTTSMTHQLPCIQTDRQIATTYLKVMLRFFSQINSMFDKVHYYSIGSGNHSGAAGWLSDLVLVSHLQDMNVECYVSNNEINYFNLNNISFVYLHGKSESSKGQFKSFPLNLNEKTRCWFNDFFADTDFNLLNKKVVLKGDLHQYAINSTSSFDYINCPSIYGSSTYIVSNFGYTKWGCAYLEVYKDGSYVSGIIND